MLQILLSDFHQTTIGIIALIILFIGMTGRCSPLLCCGLLVSLASIYAYSTISFSNQVKQLPQKTEKQIPDQKPNKQSTQIPKEYEIVPQKNTDPLPKQEDKPALSKPKDTVKQQLDKHVENVNPWEEFKGRLSNTKYKITGISDKDLIDRLAKAVGFQHSNRAKESIKIGYDGTFFQIMQNNERQWNYSGGNLTVWVNDERCCCDEIRIDECILPGGKKQKALMEEKKIKAIQQNPKIIITQLRKNIHHLTDE